LVLGKPFEHLFAAGDPGEVRAHIDKRDVLVFCCQEANGISSP